MMGSKIYKINISSFTFGQKEISSTDFHKTLKNILIRQELNLIQYHLMFLRYKNGYLLSKHLEWSWVPIVWKADSRACKRRWDIGSLKHTKKERTKANFHGEDTPCNMYCKATANIKLSLSPHKKWSFSLGI